MRAAIQTVLGLSDDVPLWVGTMHSIAYRLLKLSRDRIVTPTLLASFAHEHGLPAPRPSIFDRDGMSTTDDLSVVEATLLALSSSRHRGVPIAEEIVRIDPLADLKAVERVAALYTMWKRRHGLVDFEDMVEMGARVSVPCAAALLDEAQDNSALMWSCFDAWSRDMGVVVCVGDPWQAIYTFSGGDPTLFSTRGGVWTSLRVSHRLDERHVSYAKLVLQRGGWNDSRIASWEGSSAERPPLGRRYILCRTRWQVRRMRDLLLRVGEPFSSLSRTGFRPSPWESVDGEAARAAVALFDADASVPYAMAVTLLDVWRKAGALIPNEPRWASDAPIVAQDVVRFLRVPVETAMRALRYLPYARSAYRRYGADVLLEQPRTFVGTIHAAKGLEADDVFLLVSWGVRPSREIMNRDGLRRESCVAYVAVTRSRRTTHLLWDDGDRGVPYPFPLDPPLGAVSPIEVVFRRRA